MKLKNIPKQISKIEADLYLNKQLYDLVLLDCMLPGKDGLSILQKTRSSKDFTPVIIHSALGEVEHRVNHCC